MAKICTEICITPTCDGISITDNSGLYPDRVNGWQYTVGEPAVPTSDILSATLTVTTLGVTSEYSLLLGGYTDPALPSMLVAEIEMDIPDGLYVFDYQMEFITPENCAIGSEVTMLITKKICCCLRSLEAKALLSSESEEYEKLILGHAKLSMELHGLLASVNAELLTDGEEIKEILDNLMVRCKNLSKNCDC